jgi:hypothetical protein
MELFQILGAAALLTVAGYYVYKVYTNMYYETAVDKYGRRHKRDIRSGRFVKVK